MRQKLPRIKITRRELSTVWSWGSYISYKMPSGWRASDERLKKKIELIFKTNDYEQTTD